MASSKHSRILCALLTVVLIAGGSNPIASAGETGCYSFSAVELRLANLINDERSSQDLSPLKLDPELSRVAQRHVVEMVKAERVFHTDTRTLADRVVGWESLGESPLARETLSEAIRRLRTDPDHRRLLTEGSFRYLGVGIMRHEGLLWIEVIYERWGNPGTTLKMPDC